MNKPCAYCGTRRFLTREHIWPKFILERTNYKVRFSERAGKTFSGEMTVRDVCGVCNNGPLSRLDAYAVRLYDLYFAKFDRAREEVKFDYDFGKLVLWLLKISFNASRGSNIDSALLSQYAPYIISEYPCSPTHIGVFVGRIRPARKQDGILVKPAGTRCGRTQISSGIYDRFCSTRLLTINTYIFNIIIVRDMSLDSSSFAGVLDQVYGVPLTPDGTVVIPAPTIDTFQAMAGVQSWPRGN